MQEIITETIVAVVGTLIHNAPFLLLGIGIAAALKVYVDPERMRALLLKSQAVSIPVAVAFGAFTPFCACGSMAIVISMLTTSLPWGPIMAFLTSSPLMSPDGFVMIAGIVNIEFAVALAVASIVIGLGAGYLTHAIEKRTRFLDGQARFADARITGEASACSASGCEQASAPVAAAAVPLAAACACSGAPVAETLATDFPAASCGCGGTGPASAAIETAPSGFMNAADRLKLRDLWKVFVDIGLKQVLPYFALFAGVGHLINRFVPATLIMDVFGAGNPLAVPVLALIGLPLYVTDASALPVINSLLSGGASSGALLAFLITGPGTSAGVIAGLATIMKRKAIALYIGFLLSFAIVLGYLYDLLRAFVF